MLEFFWDISSGTAATPPYRGLCFRLSVASVERGTRFASRGMEVLAGNGEDEEKKGGGMAKNRESMVPRVEG